MKRLFTILAFIIVAITSNAQQRYKPSLHAGPQNKPSGISSATPLDSRSYFYDTLAVSYRPYANRAEVLAYLYLASYRSGQFTIIIDSASHKWAYWFRDGTADANLVLQYNFAAATTDSSIFATLYRVDTAKANLRTAIAGKISTTLPTGQILVGNLSNVATPVTPGNDVSITSGGSVTVLNQVRVSDSAAMLLPYLRKIDSTRWVSRVYNRNDSLFFTKSGSEVFASLVGSNNSDSLKHLFVDTSTNRNNYVLTFDSVNHKWILSPPGSGGGGSGTVNQVNTGLWLSGGPITNTGTIIADSAAMAAYFLRKKDSTLYFPKYRGDTLATNVYNALNGKQPTGNYITSLTGPITASGPGAAATTIANNAVTYAKIQAASAQSLLGATGAGNFQEITLGTNLSMSGSTLNASGSGGGGMDSTFQKLNWISVDSFGAKGDGYSDTTGSISSGSNTFTCVNCQFKPADVGKYFAGGGFLAGGNELVTTIAAYISPTSVSLTAAATATVTNAKYKYGTDNTTFIQNATNYAANFPAATLYFGSGRYFINGAPVTNVGGYNPNSQLYIPLGHYAPSAYQPVIRLLGATPPSLFIDFATGQAPPNSGTIIESLRTDSGAAVLGTVAENAIYGTFNWRMVYLENMQFRTKTDNQVIDIKPLMTGVNFLYQNFVKIDNCRIETSSATQSSVKPDTAAVGIYLPTINNGGNNQVNNLMVQGFHRGIIANENTHLDNFTIAACWRALQFDSSYHTIYVGRGLVVWCPYKVFVPQSQAYFDIAQLDIEHYDAAGPVWFRDSLDLDAPNMIHGCGRINYFIQVAYAGEAVQTFTRNDNFLLSNINVNPIGFGWNVGFQGGNTVQWKIGQNLHSTYPANYIFQTAPNTATHLDLMRGSAVQWVTGIGLLNPNDNDHYEYNPVTGHVRSYIDPAENISFGGPQAHINPALKIWQIGSHVTMAANDTVMGALFADSSKFGFITTGGAPMMHWQMPSATLGQKDYYQYIDDGHMYWETVDNGGTPHIFLQITQSAGVPLYTTVPTGNFGVNVAVPTERLEVGGNAVFNQAKITNSVGWSKPIELGVETTLPAISMHYAGGPSDQKNWDWYFDGTNLILRSIDDGITSTQNAYEIKRSGVNIASVSFPNGKVGIKTNTPDSTADINGSAHVHGTIRADAIPSGVGTKALRYNPSTGNFSYTDTATGGGASDTLKLAFAGTGENPFYAHIDTLFGKTDKGINSISITTGSDSGKIHQLVNDTAIGTAASYYYGTNSAGRRGYYSLSGIAGVTTMGSFGSTPNSNGGSISGSTLTLQPANGSNPGGISTTTQTLAGAKTFSADVSLPHLVGTTSTPGIAAGTGAGTSPTVTIAGNDMAGTITVVAGTLPTAGQVIATVTFTTTLSSTPRIILQPANQAVGSTTVFPVISVTGSTTQFYINCNTVSGLAAGLTYAWNYIVAQ